MIEGEKADITVRYLQRQQFADDLPEDSRLPDPTAPKQDLHLAKAAIFNQRAQIRIAEEFLPPRD